jgi:hypothetical protein
MEKRFFRLTLITLAVVSILGAVGRSAPQALTEIVVVGTVHAATPKYSVQDLVRILQKVKPDVILFEYPADMMTPAFEFKSVAKDSLEQQAVLEYVKQSGAKIRPYDIAGRNAFYERTNCFARQRQGNQELNAKTIMSAADLFEFRSRRKALS